MPKKTALGHIFLHPKPRYTGLDAVYANYSFYKGLVRKHKIERLFDKAEKDALASVSFYGRISISAEYRFSLTGSSAAVMSGWRV